MHAVSGMWVMRSGFQWVGELATAAPRSVLRGIERFIASCMIIFEMEVLALSVTLDLQLKSTACDHRHAHPTPALPGAVRNSAQPKQCIYVTLRCVAHRTARQPRPVCSASSRGVVGGTDVNAVIFAGAPSHDVLSVAIDWREAAMSAT